jgi:hypothetical protein
MKAEVCDEPSSRGGRDTVRGREASIAEHHTPLVFEANGPPVVTPTVAAALARIVRALRAAQSHEAA